MLSYMWKSCCKQWNVIFFTFLLSNKVLMKEDFSYLYLLFGFIYIYIYKRYIYIYNIYIERETKFEETPGNDVSYVYWLSAQMLETTLHLRVTYPLHRNLRHQSILNTPNTLLKELQASGYLQCTDCLR